MKKFLLTLLILLGVGVAALAGTVFWASNDYTSAGPLEQPVTIIFPRGTGFGAITDELTKQGVIRHPTLFTLRAMMEDKQSKFKAGEYAFTPGITAKEVMEMLAEGRVVERSVTIPEGYSIGQIKTLMMAETGLSGEFPENLQEGDLLPETYQYIYGDSRESIVKRMLESRQKLMDELWPKRKANLPFTTVNEALTLASIVEKETALASERGTVASVYINRLHKGMRLQADPTVEYGMTLGKAPLPRPLTYKDLETPSEYNTYVFVGLPPGPIANPGRASIEATLNPPETSFYYFVADGTGGHVFAETVEQHGKNVAAWRKVQREQR